MAVPYLQARYGGSAPERVGLKHPSIAPYGSFICADGREVVVSIQNEREWVNFCRCVLDDAALAADPRFNNNKVRTQNRVALEETVQAVFGRLTFAQAIDRLTEAQTAYGSINSVHDLIRHPQLRTVRMKVHGRTVEVPAPPYVTDWEDEWFPPAPEIGEHGPLPAPVAETVAEKM